MSSSDVAESKDDSVKKSNPVTADNEDDDDDDIPIAVLMQRARDAQQAKLNQQIQAAKRIKIESEGKSTKILPPKSSSSSHTSTQSRTVRSPKDKLKEKSKKGKSTSSSTSSSSGRSVASINTKSAQFYDSTDKGTIIQRLLVRW